MTVRTAAQRRRDAARPTRVLEAAPAASYSTPLSDSGTLVLAPGRRRQATRALARRSPA